MSLGTIHSILCTAGIAEKQSVFLTSSPQRPRLATPGLKHMDLGGEDENEGKAQ